MARSRRKAGNTRVVGKADKPSDNPAAALAAMRKTYDKVCEWEPCSKEFEGINTAKFCSNACRQANKYSKVKAKAKAAEVTPAESSPTGKRKARRSRRRKAA